MADRVIWHIGLPKTGTTYLQQILWSGRAELEAQGVWLPGSGHREHLWAASDLLQQPGLERRHRRAPGTWQRLVRQIRKHSGTAMLTHEFFCGASRAQVEQAIADLAPAKVEVVITARDPYALLRAGWQESVKNGGSATLAAVNARAGKREFSWRTWDLERVLKRFAVGVPAEDTTVVVMPGSGAAPDEHWRNFASVLGVDPDRLAIPDQAANSSLGVVQVELLRRINEQLVGFTAPVDRGVWIRGYLAENMLARQSGERWVADPAIVEECRAKAAGAQAFIAEHGVRVIGDVGGLTVPDADSGIAPEAVTEDQMLHAATRLVADMLADVRANRTPIRGED